MPLKDGGLQQEYAQAAYDIFRSSTGPQQIHVAYALLELGNALMQLGNPSEEMLKQALAILETELGVESAGAAEAMLSLGVVKGMLGEVEAAVEMLEHARAIFEQEFGPSHAKVRKY